VAQRAPGVGTWWDLCDAFESYDGAEPLADRVLPYCASQLSRWPATVTRAMPSAWLEALCRGERVPQAALANAITNWRTFDAGKLAALTRAHELDGVRVLEISRGYSSSEDYYWPSSLEPGVLPRDGIGAQVVALLEGPLRRVEVCVLGGFAVGAAEARALATLPRLRALTLEACPHDEGTLAALASGPFSSLVDLCVDCWVDSSLEVLLESSWFHQLEALALRGCHLEDAWVSGVFDDPVVSNLQALDLGANRLTSGALAHLLTSPALARLERLYLARLNTNTYHPTQQAAGRDLVVAIERMTMSGLEELGLRHSQLAWREHVALRKAADARGFRFAFTHYTDNLT
jgi:hypothetical protein